MPKMFFEPRSGEKKFLALLGGSGGMLPQKIFKIKPLRMAIIAFPELFSYI